MIPVGFGKRAGLSGNIYVVHVTHAGLQLTLTLVAQALTGLSFCVCSLAYLNFRGQSSFYYAIYRNSICSKYTVLLHYQFFHLSSSISTYSTPDRHSLLWGTGFRIWCPPPACWTVWTQCIVNLSLSPGIFCYDSQAALHYGDYRHLSTLINYSIRAIHFRCIGFLPFLVHPLRSGF